MKLLNPGEDFARQNGVNDEDVVFVATSNQLRLFASGIRETLEAVEDWEFHTRVGAQRAELRALGSELQALLREIPRQPEESN